MELTNLITQASNGILTITINRPEKLNALNSRTIQELGHVFAKAANDNDVKGIIITGSGPKAFVAGADISEFVDFNMEEGKQMSAAGHKVFDMIEHHSRPVIAAINGFALGGGLELAMSCHIRVAADSAKMGLPEVSLGIIPGYGGTQRLPQLAGKGKAFEMIMTGDMITAQEAKECGLVNHVVSQEELLKKCEEILKKILSRSPKAIETAIKAVNANYKDGVNGFQSEIDLFGKCFTVEDFKEGTKAFIEKRKPVFTGK
jgi:enoyl-CoA hydratase